MANHMCNGSLSYVFPSSCTSLGGNSSSISNTSTSVTTLRFLDVFIPSLQAQHDSIADCLVCCLWGRFPAKTSNSPSPNPQFSPQKIVTTPIVYDAFLLSNAEKCFPLVGLSCAWPSMLMRIAWSTEAPPSLFQRHVLMSLISLKVL